MPGPQSCAVTVQVSQLAGYVSEHSAYHHGDVSLTSTIVGMAQNFVGSNNVNLLYPSGTPLYHLSALTIVLDISSARLHVQGSAH